MILRLDICAVSYDMTHHVDVKGGKSLRSRLYKALVFCGGGGSTPRSKEPATLATKAKRGLACASLCFAAV